MLGPPCLEIAKGCPKRNADSIVRMKVVLAKDHHLRVEIGKSMNIGLRVPDLASLAIQLPFLALEVVVLRIRITRFKSGHKAYK